VAQCTGSGFRRLIGLVAALVWTGAVAQSPAPAPPPPAPIASPSQQPAVAGKAGLTQGRQDKQMAKSTKTQDPDIALLEYLGDYGDAADGLDPMGLADPDTPPAKSDGPPGHPDGGHS
jgi:hypothetical protein